MRFSFPQILYVDSDLDGCAVIKMLLEQIDEDYSVSLADSKEQALEMIAARHFDLYILTEPWREAFGLELCREIRVRDAATPIMMLSAMALQNDREECFRAGATEHLVMPTGLGKFAGTVQTLLENRQSGSATSGR